MKKIFAWASAIVAIMLLTSAIPMIGIVKAAIPVPHNLWGHPYDETGVQMPVGELITSWIDGVEYGRNDTFMAMAEVWFDVDTAGNWVTAPGDPNSLWEKEGGDLNEDIMYVWGDMTNIKTDPDTDLVLDYGVFTETYPWMTTDVIRFDLNLSVLADQPTHFPKISQIIPEPTDGYPDYVFIYTEDPAFLMNGYYLQKNDGVLNGPVQTLTGISNTNAYFYANLTAIDLNTCGDELKLVWTNTGSAFGGMDVVVDRVEWNATVGGCHFIEPDNTIATDATAPAIDEAIHRTGIVFADDTNDNAADFVTGPAWPRPIIGAPVLNWDIPAGGEDWTGGMDHIVQLTAYDDFALNTQLLFWINYSLLSGVPGTWFPAITDQDPQPFAGWGDAVTPMAFNWSVPCANTTVAMLNADAINPNGKLGSMPSATFEIDCQAPTVFATDPIDMAINVPVNQVPRITFSEPMNTGSVVYNISPSIGTTDAWQLTNDILDITHGTDFTPNTTYWINITAACDDSVTGNCMTGEYDFSFTTYIVTPPAITVDDPVGGEIWSGGLPHDILFTPTHGPGLASTFIWLNYSCVVAPPGTIAFGDGASLTSPSSWAVPAIDDDCTVDATIQDTDDMLVGLGSSGTFTIDSTDPTVLSNDPLDAQIDVVEGTTVVVIFSEEMVTASVVFTLVDGGPVSGTEAWSVGNTTLTFTPDNPLGGPTVYTATVAAAAKDISDPGNTLGTDHVFTFTTMVVGTPPLVTVTIPTASTLWAGGATELITWTMTDDNGAENLTVDVSYIYNSNSTVIATGLSGAVNYSWTVACPAGAGADATGVTIFVEATDADSMAANDTSAGFNIDCTPSGTVAHDGDLKVDKILTFSITNPSANIVTYAWDFGDGSVGSGDSPTHSYDEAGQYQVTCTLTDIAGNSADATPATLTIGEAPVTGDFLSEYWWLILIIIVAVVLGLIFAVAKRKKPEEEEEEAPAEEEEEEELVEEEEVVEEEPEIEEEAAPAEPEPAPSAPEAAPVAAAAPAAEGAAPAEEAPAGETKECPSCGTVVPGDASECFLCGATL